MSSSSHNSYSSIRELISLSSSTYSSLFPYSHNILTLILCDLNGKNVEIYINSSERVSILKKKASSCLENSKLKTSRAIHNSCNALYDNISLQSQNVIDGDYILFLPKKDTSLISTNKLLPISSKPNKFSINRATKYLSILRNIFPDFVSTPNSASEFFRNLRKILYLITERACILISADYEFGLSLNEYVNCDFDNVDKLEEMDYSFDEEINKNQEIDLDAVETLISMGFSEDCAKYALKLNEMKLKLATEWLIENSRNKKYISGVTSSKLRIKSLSKAQSNGKVELAINSSMNLESETHLPCNRKGNRVNKDAVNSLSEMGFDEDDVINALILHGNNQQEACDWLLCDENDKSNTIKLSNTSIIFDELFNDPVIQIGLTSSHNLQVLDDMIQNPELITHYFNDPEVGPLLVHITRFAIGHGETFS